MSARTVLNEAEKHGVKVTLNAGGDGLSLSAHKKPPVALLARLKEYKQEIIIVLRRSIYDDAFARLQAQCPPGVSHNQWQRAIADAARFFGQYGDYAVTFGWTPAHLFNVPKDKDGACGLIWWLQGQCVRALGPEHAVAANGRAYDRATGRVGSTTMVKGFADDRKIL